MNAPFWSAPEIVPLDQPGFIYPGLCCPFRAAPSRRWRSAHEPLKVRAEIEADGHVIDP
jgi:hypothetical protein